MTKNKLILFSLKPVAFLVFSVSDRSHSKPEPSLKIPFPLRRNGIKIHSTCNSSPNPLYFNFHIGLRFICLFLSSALLLSRCCHYMPSELVWKIPHWPPFSPRLSMLVHSNLFFIQRMIFQSESLIIASMATLKCSHDPLVVKTKLTWPISSCMMWPWLPLWPHPTPFSAWLSSLQPHGLLSVPYMCYGSSYHWALPLP